MNIRTYLFAALLFSIFSPLLSAQPVDKVENLLRKMTIEEKVGQMTQLTLGTFVDMSVKDRLVLKKEELSKTITAFHIGSILNNAQDHAQTQEEWLSIIRTVQDAAKSDRLSIPVLYGVDAIHGATYLKDAPLFPQQLGIACSRNPELARAMGRMAALSTRACGIRWNFAPVLDVARSPLWSRFPETFGESTHLVKVLGKANIEGAQEKGDGEEARPEKHQVKEPLIFRMKKSPEHIGDFPQKHSKNEHGDVAGAVGHASPEGPARHRADGRQRGEKRHVIGSKTQLLEAKHRAEGAAESHPKIRPCRKDNESGGIPQCMGGRMPASGHRGHLL
jgi:hypothetical protein